MFGQWLGGTIGTNKGFCVLNIEPGAPLEGRIMFFDMDQTKHSMWASVSFKIENDKITGNLYNYLVFYKNELIKSEELNKEIAPERYPVTGEINGSFIGGKLKGNFKTNVNTFGEFILTKTVLGEPTKPNREMSWGEYKKFVSELDRTNKVIIFRGQSNNNQRLVTTYHRSGRADLFRYLGGDIPNLVRFINLIPPYKYDLNKIGDLDALLGLVQHHEYPTPFLDWTESPYIAAYFAYRKAKNDQQTDKVRIFIFDTVPWVSFWQAIAQNTILIAPKPVISIHNLTSTNNNRAIRQKAVSVFSNIVDMEAFFDASKETGKLPDSFFQRIDLPYSEKEAAMNDLLDMEISTATLFPGLDGVCRFLSEQYFGKIN
jgi:hypothetical protein